MQFVGPTLNTRASESNAPRTKLSCLSWGKQFRAPLTVEDCFQPWLEKA